MNPIKVLRDSLPALQTVLGSILEELAEINENTKRTANLLEKNVRESERRDDKDT
jgi:hypothetical protein